MAPSADGAVQLTETQNAKKGRGGGGAGWRQGGSEKVSCGLCERSQPACCAEWQQEACRAGWRREACRARWRRKACRAGWRREACRAGWRREIRGFDLSVTHGDLIAPFEDGHDPTVRTRFRHTHQLGLRRSDSRAAQIGRAVGDNSPICPCGRGRRAEGERRRAGEGARSAEGGGRVVEGGGRKARAWDGTVIHS